MTEGRIDVGATSDFAEGTMTGTKVNGSEVLIVKQRGEYFALEDRCTHDNGILHDGDLLEGAVKCDRHGARFDLHTGRPTLPAVKKVRIYHTEVQGDRLIVIYQEA
ncbi:MAG: ferredoxin [Trueperaceae bacterium]|jgi:3-phenylpropionate/trans-cinnamate dioxygenase ferredoxin subunit|nr:ferredoxin [Trueperaceae bacterium]MCH2667805.1 Rieske 2Fe-2S domain-containing protein [Deinococcales bacterium]|tara:strand:+ start:450 stop:767 length:318 start_codon:yes stop_codon:yes gene_type:complete